MSNKNQRMSVFDEIANEMHARETAQRSNFNTFYQPDYFYLGMQHAFNDIFVSDDLKNNKSFMNGYDRGKRLLSIYGSYDKIPNDLIIVKPKEGYNNENKTGKTK